MENIELNDYFELIASIPRDCYMRERWKNPQEKLWERWQKAQEKMRERWQNPQDKLRERWQKAQEKLREQWRKALAYPSLWPFFPVRTMTASVRTSARGTASQMPGVPSQRGRRRKHGMTSTKPRRRVKSVARRDCSTLCR